MSNAEFFLFFANLGSLYLGYHLGLQRGFKNYMDILFEKAKSNSWLRVGLMLEGEKISKRTQGMK